MNINDQINVSSIKTAVDNCCRSDDGCFECKGKECLIGFDKLVAEYADTKKTITIPNGLKLVPGNDFKIYDADKVATALAIINFECKNCMDNHDDNCVVNIMRSTLEVALFGKHIDFSGNPLSYVMSLSQINPALGSKVMQMYRWLKK